MTAVRSEPGTFEERLGDAKGDHMPKVLLIIGDAAEVLDTMYAYFRLPEDGFEVVVAAPEKRLYHLVMHEQPPGWDITRERPGYHLPSDIAFRDVHPDEYAGLFCSGGRAPEVSALQCRSVADHALVLRVESARGDALPRDRNHRRSGLHPKSHGHNDRQMWRSTPRRRARPTSIAPWSSTETSSRPADGLITRCSSRNSSAC